jgi:hypothetical protein
MAVLNNWQRFDRIGLLYGSPFGDGVDGVSTVSSDPNTRATITGTATQTTGTAGSSAFTNGDLVVLHQTQGTGVGQWEVNKVASGGGTTSLTFQVAHHFTYGTGAQIIKVPRYTTATVSAHSVTAWNGTTGGIEVICAKTSITVSGALSANDLGFRCGNGAQNESGDTGEGTTGAAVTSRNANGNGGGGGNFTSNVRAPGGGGGHGTAGSNGVGGFNGVNYGYGGNAVGSADGTTFNLGGAGGEGCIENGADGPDNGGEGGGVFILISPSIICSAAVTSNGETGGANPTSGSAGGSGAGGTIIFVCVTASLGTSITASGGPQTTGAGSERGGAGGAGIIAVHHSGTVTGTTTPTFTDVEDLTLKEASGGGFILALL